METLTCFSYACSAVSQETREQLKYSNKILLPASILHKMDEQDDVEYPLFFKVTNPICEFGRVCAVHEFTATEGLVNVPYYILEDLGLQEGSPVTIEYINPPKGSYIKLKPHETEFIELHDPKLILEHIMSKDYPVVTKGQTIVINYKDMNKTYRIDVVDTQPSETIKIINTDLDLDFDQPHDYVEPIVNNIVEPDISPSRNIKLDEFKQTGKFVPFSGNGHTLGSK